MEFASVSGCFRIVLRICWIMTIHHTLPWISLWRIWLGLHAWFYFSFFFIRWKDLLESLSSCRDYNYIFQQGIVSHESASCKVPLLISTIAYQLFLSGIFKLDEDNCFLTQFRWSFIYLHCSMCRHMSLTRKGLGYRINIKSCWWFYMTNFYVLFLLFLSFKFFYAHYIIWLVADWFATWTGFVWCLADGCLDAENS